MTQFQTETVPVSDQAGEPVIVATDVEKWYDNGFHVLKGVSMTVYKGEVLVVMGPSGSGKSTFIRTFNALEPYQKGSIEVDGIELAHDLKNIEAIRREVGMVFQQFNLWAHLTILQNVMEAPVTVLGRDKAEVEEKARHYLDKVGIGDKADVFPAQMSGGQQQRAAIARALAMEPEALLFDEPTSALDPELEQEVVRVIKGLAEEGRTMMIVTHDMKMAHDVSDHVVFLHEGLIEEEGAPDTLFGAPKSERLRQFLSSTMAV